MNEEFTGDTPPQNIFFPLTYEDCFDISDKLTSKEKEKLGFNNEEDLWDFINQQYTITE